MPQSRWVHPYRPLSDIPPYWRSPCQGEVPMVTASPPRLPCYMWFSSHLLGRNSSISYQLFFRINYFIHRCVFSMSVGWGEFRVFLCLQLGRSLYYQSLSGLYWWMACFDFCNCMLKIIHTHIVLNFHSNSKNTYVVITFAKHMMVMSILVKTFWKYVGEDIFTS